MKRPQSSIDKFIFALNIHTYIQSIFPTAMIRNIRIKEGIRSGHRLLQEMGMPKND